MNHRLSLVCAMLVLSMGLTACSTTPDETASVPAADDVRMLADVQLILNDVKSDQAEAFEAWLADYRAAVEGMIAEGKLRPADQRAYEHWRVLGPNPTTRELFTQRGDDHTYIFIFDPLVHGANYSLQHHLTNALGADEAAARVQAFQAMLAREQVWIQGVPR